MTRAGTPRTARVKQILARKIPLFLAGKLAERQSLRLLLRNYNQLAFGSIVSGIIGLIKLAIAISQNLSS